jgi:energy-coupling factor transporter transmembrane protein EcfT
LPERHKERTLTTLKRDLVNVPLLGVVVILLVPGFLMKSPTMIISGIGMIALSYVAATIPFWIVSSVMGLFILVMIFVNPKTGKIDWTPWNKDDDGPKETPPPTQSPAA